MAHRHGFKSAQVVRWCVFILGLALASQAVWAQAPEVFRSVGLDLNVDPEGVISDAGGLIDIDQDGWIDIFPGSNFCLNNGVADGSLKPFTDADSTGVYAECRFADYNNDGLLDAYATMQVSLKDFLFKNNGNMKFTEVGESMGIDYPDNKFSLACGWADYNKDGWVDLLVGMVIEGGPGSGIFLWKNEGGTHFVNVATQMQINVSGMWHGMVWADIDDDRDPDFFVAGGRNGDMLFRNDGDRFVDITSITKTSGVGVIGHSRSGAWGDYNNDGRLDLYVCDDEKANRLFRNEGAGVWPNVAAELHVDNYDPAGWGVNQASATAVWGDYDNDADLDLFVSSQEGQYSGKSENKLYRNDGAAGFVEVGHTMAITDQGQKHYAAAFGDVDNDGDLDLYVQVGPTLIPPGLGGGMDLLFENLIGNNNNWLEFRLTGAQSNRSAIGARIRCVAGDLSQIREVQGGNGYNSMNPFTQHFGFQQRTRVDSVIVRWPSGKVDQLLGVPVNQIINLTEGSTTGVKGRYAMPTNLSLAGNYPNPFNSQTVIDYTVPELSKVRLTIVDMSGRQVRTLVEDRLLSGRQQVRWDGRDDYRHAVASGAYLCRLQVDDASATHTMLLLK